MYLLTTNEVRAQTGQTGTTGNIIMPRSRVVIILVQLPTVLSPIATAMFALRDTWVSAVWS